MIVVGNGGGVGVGVLVGCGTDVGVARISVVSAGASVAVRWVGETEEWANGVSWNLLRAVSPKAQASKTHHDRISSTTKDALHSAFPCPFLFVFAIGSFISRLAATP